MDRSLFGPDAPGEFVQVSAPAQGWAFVPKNLPADWELPSNLWPMVAEAREALGTLNGIGQVLPNPMLLLAPLQNREAIASSRIEGTYVTPEQLLLYQLDPREPRSADDKMADWNEVLAYARALIHGSKMLGQLPVCNRIIREIHEILMQGVRGRHKQPGEFRKGQVQIGTSGRFVPPPPTKVPELMDNLEKYVNSPHGIDPLVRCFIVHYQFEAIHPFMDGNGRVGRVLLALMVSYWFKHTYPWLYLSAYFDRYKDEYINGLFKISTTGDWTPWVEFCLRATIAQAKDSVARCHSFNLLRTQFHERIKSPTARTHKVIEMLFSTPGVTIASLRKDLGVAYQTAQSDIDRLVEVGILREMQDHQPRSFFAPEIISIAYREPEELGPKSD